jgi:glycosyltransferase involved in cell wall biosynthesis
LIQAGHHVAAGKALSSTLRSLGVEVVHFPYQRYFETDLPFIFEPWDLQHLHYPENFTEQELRVRDRLYREACQRASLVVVPTRWGKRDLVAHLTVDAHKVAVITRGGANVSHANGKHRQDLPPRYIVYPAKFWPHKNHRRLLEALALLRSNGCIVPLVCTGEPVSALPQDFCRFMNQTSVLDQVSFLGHLERTQLTEVLANAEMLVFPSLFEGFGIPVLEAMSLGVPIACSRIGPLEEIAGGAARYFNAEDATDIANAIGALWTDADLRKSLAALGNQRASDFRWTQSVRDFVICYKHLSGRELSHEENRRFAVLVAS